MKAILQRTISVTSFSVTSHEGDSMMLKIVPP